MEKKTYITPELLETVACPMTIIAASEGWAIDNDDGDPNNIIVIGEDDSGDDEFIDLD